MLLGCLVSTVGCADESFLFFPSLLVSDVGGVVAMGWRWGVVVLVAMPVRVGKEEEEGAMVTGGREWWLVVRERRFSGKQEQRGLTAMYHN